MTTRKKSETRQRTKGVYIRLTPSELERLDSLAQAAGLKRAAYTRQKALGDAGPRAQRQPSADRQELAELLGQIGKIGSNVNQLSHRANIDGFGAVSKADMKAVVTAVSDMRAALMEALGRRGY